MRYEAGAASWQDLTVDFHTQPCIHSFWTVLEIETMCIRPSSNPHLSGQKCTMQSIQL